jgi:hypothetical protein
MASLREQIDFLYARDDDLYRLHTDIETRLAKVEQQLTATHQTVDEFLDAISQQNAVARETRREQLETRREQLEARRDQQQNQLATWDAQSRTAEGLARLEARVEFIRKEVMLEIQFGADKPAEVPEAEPQILDEEKLESRPLRLNLGCGHIALDGFVNVDGRALPGVDVVAEVGSLPVVPGEVAEIRSSHLLEHFPAPKLAKLLRYWTGLLEPGGRFVAVVPDAESMIHGFAGGEFPWEDLREVTFGGQEYSGDFHFTMFSQADLTAALTSAGLVDVKITEAGRRNGACLEMEAVAYKPTAE